MFVVGFTDYDGTQCYMNKTGGFHEDIEHKDVEVFLFMDAAKNFVSSLPVKRQYWIKNYWLEEE